MKRVFPPAEAGGALVPVLDPEKPEAATAETFGVSAASLTPDGYRLNGNRTLPHGAPS